MIRFLDALMLAHTKVRTHRVRTGLTVGIAGLLFGLILFVIIVVQGALSSVDRFSREGLGNRMIVMVTNYQAAEFNVYGHLGDAAFIAEVEHHHQAYVAKKTELARKYMIAYDAKTEDPSPVEIDPETKKKRISEAMTSNTHVVAVVQQRSSATPNSFDIAEYLAPYKSAKVLSDNQTVQPKNGELTYMREGKEWTSQDERDQTKNPMGADELLLSIANETLTEPFIVAPFDPTKGEIPVVMTFAQAEKALGLKRLSRKSTNEERLHRLEEVRRRVGEVTAAYCYRNEASLQLLSEAKLQQADIERNKNNRDYPQPAVQYALPAADSCGAVEIVKDTRTTLEKQQDERQIAYEKELGTYVGEPEQRKITVRGVGISGDMPDGMTSTVGEMVMGLLGSWLGYDETFTIPADLLKQMPVEDRPEELFRLGGDNAGMDIEGFVNSDVYFVEFMDKQDARAALDRSNTSMMSGNSNTHISPYGSATLVVDELKTGFERALLWALSVVGGIALIILASIIGRTISEGRRESAVFRAIGARRGDIGTIYGVYAFLLSMRVAVFALVLGGALALVVELLYWRDATIGARLAYAASDTTQEFHLFSIWSWHIMLVIGAILVVGLLASVLPIMIGARRNPIRDMRNE